MVHKEYRLSAVMFTDIQGFSKMMEADEVGTIKLMEYHNELVSRHAAHYNGSIIKTIGDAFLLDFRNTTNAVKCGIAVQDELAEYNKENPGTPLVLRIGIHLGDIYFYENDALGESINIASRLQSCATPGSICISRDVYSQVSNKIDAKIQSKGVVPLKNITKEIHAYEIITKSTKQQEKVKTGPSSSSEKQRDDSSQRNAGMKDPEADFEEVKNLVVENLKRAGQQIPVDKLRQKLPRNKEVDEVLTKLAEKGFLRKVEDPSGTVAYDIKDRQNYSQEPAYGERGNQDSSTTHIHHTPRRMRRNSESKETRKSYRSWQRYKQDTGLQPRFPEYKAKLEDNLEKAQAGFRGHLAAYLGVNSFLFFIWATTSAGFPWFLIPLAGWGIGIANHRELAGRLKKEKREIDSMPENISAEEFKDLKEFHKLRAAFRSHVTSSLSVTGLLFIINMITSAGFPWFLFPAVPLVLSSFVHWTSYKVKKSKLLKRLKSLFKGGRSAGSASVPTSGSSTDQAEQLRQSILKQARSMGKKHSVIGSDIEPLLNNYVEQIKMLDQKGSEIDDIIRGIPVGELERDLVRLKQKQTTADSDYMKKEYQKSIHEIQDQKKSFQDLKNQREVLKLRSNSALNTLKQMHMDLARMKTMSESEERANVSMLREKSRELSSYLEDLRSSYDELESGNY
ncbi:MAG: 2TM domain-containing protein [Spirochaetia bacterium]